MERRIGEVFEFEGKNLKVIQSDDCCGCYFESEGKGCLNKSHDLTGECNPLLRDFNVGVIFKDVEEIQRSIGEVFRLSGVEFEVAKGTCEDCHFNYGGCRVFRNALGECEYFRRIDRTNVCFKLRKNETD